MNQFIPSVIRGFLSEKLLELDYWLRRNGTENNDQPLLIPVPARRK